MITPKIKNLFNFIEFLHSNIENFNRYEKEINELYLLNKERQKLNPLKNFAEKQEYDKIQLQIKDKHKVIQDNIIQPIKDKANELSICNPDESPTIWNRNITEIIELKNNFSNEDLPEIFSHKNKYLEYRTATKGETFFGLGLFFDNLDELLKELFDYFKETEQNEFENFETKPIPVNDIDEMIKLSQFGKFQKFTLTNSLFKTSTVQQLNIETLPSQQNEKPKPELKLKDFFIKDVSNDTIEAIQAEFRELEGKDLAILIYLLHKEHKIIEILTNSKTKGRKSFVKCLTETDNPSMQGVNKCFVANTDDLIYSKDDLVFQSLNKRLTKIIKKSSCLELFVVS